MHAREKFNVSARARCVPFLQRDIAGILVHINLAFDQHEEVRFDGDAGASQALHQAGHVAAGVDDPFCAAGLQLPDQMLKLSRNRRVLKFGKNGAVEIGGYEPQRRFHATCSIAENALACNLWKKGTKVTSLPLADSALVL